MGTEGSMIVVNTQYRLTMVPVPRINTKHVTWRPPNIAMWRHRSCASLLYCCVRVSCLQRCCQATRCSNTPQYQSREVRGSHGSGDEKYSLLLCVVQQELANASQGRNTSLFRIVVQADQGNKQTMLLLHRNIYCLFLRQFEWAVQF
jgi:hypothetical protein